MIAVARVARQDVVAPPPADPDDWGHGPISPRFIEAVDRAQAAHVPLTIQWELTKTCNLRCVHCYFMPGAPKGDLTTAECLGILDQLAEAGTLFLNLTGGEAMTRRDFFEIAEAAVEREFAVRLLTNATFINARNIERFVQIGFTSVDVSILGDEAAHERIALIPGSYRKAVRAIEMMREREQAVILKYPVMKTNMHAYDHVRALADRLGTGLVMDVTMVCRNDGDYEPLNLMAGPDELAAFLQRVNGNKPTKAASNLSGDGPSCNAGRSMARISHDGGVHTCIASQECIGNLRERPFVEIWNSRGFNKWRSYNLDDLPVCRACEAKHVCLRCPGQAQTAEGDLFAPSLSACRMAKLRLDMMAREQGLTASPIVPEGLRLLAAAAEDAWSNVPAFLPVIGDADADSTAEQEPAASRGCGSRQAIAV